MERSFAASRLMRCDSGPPADLRDVFCLQVTESVTFQFIFE